MAFGPTGCAVPEALTRSSSAPSLESRGGGYRPVFAEPLDLPQTTPGVQPREMEQGPKVSAIRVQHASDFDVLLTLPSASSERWVCTPGGISATPGGLTLSRMGDVFFRSDGAWIRRTADGFRLSDGGRLTRQGRRVAHPNGVWSEAVGDAIIWSDGSSCTIKGEIAHCRDGS